MNECAGREIVEEFKLESQTECCCHYCVFWMVIPSKRAQSRFVSGLVDVLVFEMEKYVFKEGSWKFETILVAVLMAWLAWVQPTVR